MTPSEAPSPRAVFCDFDGTISAGETFVRLLKGFVPELAAELIPRIHAFEITLREGVTEMLESIPSERWPQAVACADEVPLRDGFAELVSSCRRHDIPFIVVSGGLDAMIRRKLGPLAEQVTAIHAIEIDASGPRLQVISPFADEVEMVAKVAVMARYPAIDRIAIGDSTTDVRMSEVAELVFARDRLQGQLDERGVAYTPWQDFHDVRRHLSARWGLDV